MTSITTDSSRSHFRTFVTAVVVGIVFCLPGLTNAQAPTSFQFVAEVVAPAPTATFVNLPVGTVITGRVTYDATGAIDLDIANVQLGVFALPSPASQGGFGFPLLTPPPSPGSNFGSALTTTSDLNISTQDVVGDDAVQISASGGMVTPAGFTTVNFSLDFPTEGTTCVTDILSSDAIPDRATLELFFSTCGATLFVVDPAVGSTVRAEMTSITVDPISGTGTAALDGSFGTGEWDNAASAKFGLLLPDNTTIEADMFVMSDTTNLYVGIQYPRTAVDDGQNLSLRFDNNGDGVFIEPAFNIPEDSISFDGDTTIFRDSFTVAGRNTVASPGGWFGDIVDCGAPPASNCSFQDTSDGGITDGAGSFGNDLTLSTFELSHPINSGDKSSIAPVPYDRDISVAFNDTIGVGLAIFLTDPGGRTARTVFTAGQSGGTDQFIEVLIAAPVAPDAMDDLATAGCGVGEDILVLNNDDFLVSDPFTVSAQTPTDKGGTTVVNGSPNSDPSLIFVTYTSAAGFDGIDTFEYTVTDDNGGSDTATVTVTVDGSTCPVVPGDDQVIFKPDPNSDQPVTAIVQEVVKAGTISQTSCVIEDDRGLAKVELDLIEKVKTTQDCIDKGVVAKLKLTDKAKLKKYQRAFEDPVDSKKKIVVTLIRSKNTSGNPDDLTKGVLVSEEEPLKQLVKEPLCDDPDVSKSPSTVGVNLSGNEPSGDKARNLTSTCNRPRNASHLSDQLLAFPIRNDSAFVAPQIQVNKEAGDFRDAIKAEQATGCVVGAHLRNLMQNFNKAMRLVNKGEFEDGIVALNEVSLIALVPAPAPDPYGTCPNDPKGHLVSRLMDLTYHVHRGLRFPNTFVKFDIDPRILAELPPFPGDLPPIP